MRPQFDRPTLLMCPPDYYGIEYEINPWMSRSRQSDSSAAHGQWHALHALIESFGMDVRLMDPIKGLPDLVFTANAGLIWNETAFVSRFRHEARQGETVYDEKRIFERSAVIQVGIDARDQKYSGERRYRYQPFAGREDEFRLTEANWDRWIKDYTTRDLNI